jgi:hypothetical protein
MEESLRMAEEPSIQSIHEIPYLRLFPWLRLFRAPGIAADPKKLMLASLGLLLMFAGWDLLDRVFPKSSGVTPEVFETREAIGLSNWRSIPWSLTEPARRITAPFFAVFDPPTPADPTLWPHAILAALWTVVVWGLIGGAIARVAVVGLAKGERVSVREALRFSLRKAVPLIGTPLIPVMGIVFVSVFLAVFGLLYRTSWGAIVAGGLAFLPLIGGLLLALIVVLLGFGWPLMQASVATEVEDGFDAMSCAYAYVRQRPWHLAFYAGLAVAIGSIGLIFVDLFARLVVHLTVWSLSLGGPRQVISSLFHGNDGEFAPAAVVPHRFWLSVVGLLVRGWIYSVFWTFATMIYLLLRREVDGTPFGKVSYEGRRSLLAQAAAAPVSPLNVPSHPRTIRDADRA